MSLSQLLFYLKIGLFEILLYKKRGLIKGCDDFELQSEVGGNGIWLASLVFVF